MNQLEIELKQMLSDRALDPGSLPQIRPTVRRARVRRVVTAGVGTLVAVALATVSVAGVRAFTSTDVSPPDVAGPGYTTKGSYGFTSVEGEYPVVARGEFRTSEWELTAVTSDRGEMPTVLVQLSVSSEGRTSVEEFEVLPSDDVLMTSHIEAPPGLGAGVVFGATVPGIDSVEVDVADGDGTRIAPHRFVNYDSRSEMTVDYYVAFIPEEVSGFVHARNELGIDIELEGFGGARMAPHVFTGGRVVVDGEPTGIGWNLEFGVVGQDRACLVLATETSEHESRCFTHRDIRDAGPLHVVTFEHDDMTLVAALIGGEVGNAQLTVGGGEPMTLPWFQPKDEDLAEWPVRVVAVGLGSGSHGVLQAIADDGGILEEASF